MRTSQVRVAIDLETTGLHPEHDAIIEIGALKFAGDEVLETFESFVSTGTAIPYRIQRLTGISGTQLRGAPDLATLLPRLRDFLGDHPLVGHSVPFDAAFLRRVGLARRNPLVDTYELASALLPGLPSYTLASVGAALGVSSPTYHRALADAQLARDIFLALLERLRALDPSTLLALDRLPAPLDWTPAYFVRQAVREQGLSAAPGTVAGSTIGDLLAARLGMDLAVLSLAVARTADDTPSGAPPSADPPAVASDSVGSGGEAGTAAADGAADRLCQMVSGSVRDALAGGHTLLVEHHHAADGVLACLGAILQWAYASGERALICAADESAARQLIARLIPAALSRAGISAAELPVASLCARESYFCLHRWYGAARLSLDGPLPRDTARGLAKLAVWLPSTQTGALGEVTLSGQELAAWERTRAGAEFIDSDTGCAYHGGGCCFVVRARAAAERARVIVTTHRALAAQLVEGSSVLALASRTLVFDAHLLEDELRAVRSLTLDRQTLLADLGALALVEGSGRRTGLFHLATQRLDAASAKAREQQWFAQVERTRQAAEQLFTALRALLSDSHEEANGNPPPDSPEQRTLRLDSAARELAAWRPLVKRWEELAARLAATVRLARDAARLVLAARGPKTPPAADGVATELLACARRLERALDCGARILIGGSDDDLLRWLRVPYPAIVPGTAATSSAPRRSGARPRHRQPISLPPADADPLPAADVVADSTSGSAVLPALLAASAEGAEIAEAPVLHAAPVQVGRLLAQLCPPERSLVLAAPALAVGGDFAYTRSALGLSEAARTLGPAVECENQTLLCLPTDVPEPNAPQFQRRLDDALLALAAALRGRLVVLFPSHAALRSTAQSLKRALERLDILALAQGQDGSIRQLWQTFRTEPRVVLLGAGAFWEGAAQVEAPPACIVVTRLPFPALSDPLLAARADQWADTQNQFVVPHAALRLRHALGGLAWSHTRKNAVVLFDRRIQTRAYGPTILATLPRCEQYQETVAQIAERAAEWVG